MDFFRRRIANFSKKEGIFPSLSTGLDAFASGKAESDRTPQKHVRRRHGTLILAGERLAKTRPPLPFSSDSN
jgi:hypothetical protein